MSELAQAGILRPVPARGRYPMSSLAQLRRMRGL